MQETTIVSVGIDIGTTTTQLVFSELTLHNTSGPTQAPRYAISRRAIIYSSPVVFTPKKRVSASDSSDEDNIDEKALAALVHSWYAQAGFTTAEVPNGAIIITGESLKASNARQAVMRLADSLGNFVVAGAGPHMESVIAARGSGAADLSRRLQGTVLNIDIGGGTANYAVLQNGEVQETACVNIGGRLVETSQQGEAVRIRAPGRLIARNVFGGVPHRMGPEQLRTMAGRMAEMLYELTQGTVSPLTRQLLQTPPLQGGRAYDAVTLSGGVGACCQNPGGNPFRYGDMGPVLAEALLQNPGMRTLPVQGPAVTVQATVIGAGAWPLSLSGSTVWADHKGFPLRNIPVIGIALEWPPVQTDLAACIRERLAHGDIDPVADAFVLAFPSLPASYAVVRHLAQALAGFHKSMAPRKQPLLVAVCEDIGKALGMELKPDLAGAPLVVIDEVWLKDGEYLDIGIPQEKGGFIPLVIKSLAFSGEGSQQTH